MRRVIVIGAGQLGSRHIQALKAVKEPLEITVVDPAEASLQLTKERFEQIIGSPAQHAIKFLKELPGKLEHKIDLSIIATSSNVRFQALTSLLRSATVENIIVEKILFTEPIHYKEVLPIVAKSQSKVWVNCCMREIGIYRKIKDLVNANGPVNYTVTSSRFGLLTNLIHYLDHMNHVLNLKTFSVDVTTLDKEFIPSKRAGFQECTGTLSVRYQDGSTGTFVNFTTGELPIVVEISSGSERFIVRETEGKAWHCGASTAYNWVEIEALITPQSILTTKLAEDIFTTGNCLLTGLEESVVTHLSLYEPIREHFGLKSYLWT